MNDKEAVLQTLEEYADAYCLKDVDRLMSIFVDSEDISVIGTGENELCSGQEAVRSLFVHNFKEATAKRFEWHWQRVTGTGACAVVATTLTIHLETDSGPLSVPIRWTVSMVKVNSQWRWLHRHASIAASGQNEDAAYPTGMSSRQHR